MYRFFAELAGARVAALRYDEEMRFPVDAVVRALRQPPKRCPRVLYIANPNNPTGTLVRREELRRILRAASRTLVLVDEAYFDFSGLTILSWIRRYPNLLVARTFSKSAGLAALRVGCLFGKPEILAAMRRACTPYPVNSAALVAAEAASQDPRFLRNYTREVLQSRAMLEKGLVRLGARIYPSSGNFVLADFGPVAHRLVRALERKGILVRGRRDFPREGFVRISAGTRAETRKVLRAMERIL
jgi:histidinol-phosphate aminotransferase